MHITKTNYHNKLIRMGKKKASNSPKQSSKNIGRPQDDDLETFFMKKLRNGKLQTITAESQTEILSYNLTVKYDNTKKKPTDKNGENQSVFKVAYIKNWFEEKDGERFQLLWKSFERAAEKWQFKEINSIKDFPEYLFCDECDLSYILHEALTSDFQDLKTKTQILNDELLYYELLCFASRNQISMTTLRTIQEKYEEFLQMMTDIKSAVVHCGQEILSEEKAICDLEHSYDEDSEEGISECLRNGDVKDFVQKVDCYEYGSENEKTKLIEKTKKKGRPPKPNAEKSKELLTEDQFKDIAEKLIAHMTRAYAYIYPSELRKNQALKNSMSLQEKMG